MLGKVGGRGVNRSEVSFQRTVPGQDLVRSDHGVVDPLILGVLNQVQDIGDLVQVELPYFNGSKPRARVSLFTR